MNTNSRLKEYIKEEAQLLSKELQWAIDTFEWEKIAKEIGNEHEFADTEILALQTETGLVLVGLVDLKLYSQNLESNIGISEQEAKTIENEVINKIFNPMAKEMEEKLKNGLGLKNILWDQNINFIVSGGDYSTFLERPVNNTNIKNKLV